jgi:hypothetical protein
VEAMSKFKLGSKVKVIEITLAYNGGLKVGDIAAIQEFQSSHNRFVRLIGDDSNACSWHDVNNIELVEPKWTIYNNTLPWSDLSDKQKGKLLLAQNNKLKFEDFTSSEPTMPFSNGWVYVVEKPEPTMETVFANDWFNECGQSPKNMVAKGWIKP